MDEWEVSSLPAYPGLSESAGIFYYKNYVIFYGNNECQLM